MGEYFLFFYMKVPRRNNFVKAVKGMSMEKQLKAEGVAEQALDGPPAIVDQRQHAVSIFCSSLVFNCFLYSSSLTCVSTYRILTSLFVATVGRMKPTTRRR